jgi:hypothetical protein
MEEGDHRPHQLRKSWRRIGPAEGQPWRFKAFVIDLKLKI